jgi:hypothetical protein
MQWRYVEHLQTSNKLMKIKSFRIKEISYRGSRYPRLYFDTLICNLKEAINESEAELKCSIAKV